MTPVGAHPLTNPISNFWSVTREKHEGNDRRRFPWKDVLEVKARLRTCIASEGYGNLVSSTAVQYMRSTCPAEMAEMAEIEKPGGGWGRAELQAGIGASIGVIVLPVP